MTLFVSWSLCLTTEDKLFCKVEESHLIGRSRSPVWRIRIEVYRHGYRDSSSMVHFCEASHGHRLWLRKGRRTGYVLEEEQWSWGTSLQERFCTLQHDGSVNLTNSEQQRAIRSFLQLEVSNLVKNEFNVGILRDQWIYAHFASDVYNTHIVMWLDKLQSCR